ncbi:MAG: hypothetical protein FWE10_03400 [Rikenellaceae bacterium]|nr:hypothetical protein [Rikenellaceae bacterium]MCL2693068.1 hypothetical protein [Rikenellaceae bacterium]
MGKYKLEAVETARQRKEFTDLPKKLYKGNRYWVCPLDDDIEARFDPARNELFRDGDARRWMVRDVDSGEVVGRIAAFYNRALAALNDQPTGGCGFFESIDNQDVANMLFDAAKQWLAECGMEAMDGPINFGDRDQWWGLLVEGFEFQPTYANNYNPPYYRTLFENYGFRNYFNQHTYYRNLRIGELNPTVYDRVRRLEEIPGYRFEHIRKANLDQVAHDFRLIYNKAWALIPGVRPMDEHHATKMMATLRPIIDERLVYFAYFNDEPIGFFIMIPDLNRIIGRFNGRLTLLGKLRLMAMLKFTKKADRVFGVIFGVVPEFQGKGVEAGMICAFEQIVARGEVDYKTLELTWIGDFNPVMMRVVENYVCAQRLKMHTTYRLLFDPAREFTRCPRMGAKKRE